jgi:hypothetical protein
LLCCLLPKLIGLLATVDHRLLALPERHADASPARAIYEEERTTVSADSAKRRERVSILVDRVLTHSLGDANSRRACVHRYLPVVDVASTSRGLSCRRSRLVAAAR